MAARLDRLPEPALDQAEFDAARRSYRYYAWLGLANAAGTVTAARGGELGGQDVSQRQWFRRAAGEPAAEDR